MKDSPNLLRRSILTSVPLVAGLAACTPRLATRQAWVYDPTNPKDVVRNYVKIAGSLSEQQIYLQYYGEIISITPGEVQKPLFRLKGLVRQRWSPQPDNTYAHSNYDHGLFCDWDTGKVLEQYENPYTGETNTPLHYNSGPLESTIGLGDGQEDPTDKEWRTMGSQISVTQTRIGRDFNNPVQPDKYPKASTGKKVQYSWTSTYFADARELGDESLNTVDADHTWMFLTNYPAWMHMGDAPGFALWRWSGKKFSAKAEIDPYILGEVEARIPGFLTVEKPWPERSDGWTQYSREREPVDK